MLFGYIGNLIGGAVRDVIELGDVILEDIKSIPDELSKGYDKGLISNGDNQAPVKDKPVTPTQSSPKEKTTTNTEEE